MNIKDQIRAEIERLIRMNQTKNGFPAGTNCAIRIETYEHLLSFLDSLPEQPVEGLDEAAGKYAWQKEEPLAEGERLSTCFNPRIEAFKAGAEWGMNQCPLPEDTTIFNKGVAEGRLERDEQKPELVQHPAISYMYDADADRDEQLRQALLALLKSDLIQVAGRRFTKMELIDWVETRPAEMK